MAQQTIGIGSVPNDGTGDTLRVAMDKVNDNTTELYTTAVQPTYFYFSGGTIRIGIRSGTFKVDKTLTGTGFAGAQDTDWENIFSAE